VTMLLILATHDGPCYRLHSVELCCARWHSVRRYLEHNGGSIDETPYSAMNDVVCYKPSLPVELCHNHAAT